MTPEQRERRDQQITEFRYQLVAELANPYLSATKRRELIRQKAQLQHEVPFLGPRRYSVGCIHKWLDLYRKHGRAGLAPRPRRDAGRARSLSDTEAAVFLNYLENHPELTASAALRTLQTDGRITGTPSSSALSRLVRSAGLHRAARQRQAHGEQRLKFEFFAPLECVQADFMYGPRLPTPNGRRRPTLLLAFLDDATRRVVYACWGFSESAVAFEAGIHHILAAHGRIGRLYCDHGSPFVSNQTKRILDALGLIISHSRVGKPAGRGKVERFFRTVRQQFLAPLDTDQLAGVADLDQRFHTWLESEYHCSPHRGLKGATPLETWLAKCHLIVALDPTVDLAEAFRHQATRKVHRDSTVTLRRCPVRAAFHPHRRAGRAALRPYLAAGQPPSVRPPPRSPHRRGAPGRHLRQRARAPAPTCASIPQATMRRMPPATQWPPAPTRLTNRCLPPPPPWPPPASP